VTATRRDRTGLYFGDVADATIDRVLPYIVPPSDDEGFTLRRRS
jgi:hypothetical protein